MAPRVTLDVGTERLIRGIARRSTSRLPVSLVPVRLCPAAATLGLTGLCLLDALLEIYGRKAISLGRLQLRLALIDARSRSSAMPSRSSAIRPASVSDPLPLVSLLLVFVGGSFAPDQSPRAARLACRASSPPRGRVSTRRSGRSASWLHNPRCRIPAEVENKPCPWPGEEAEPH
jgi:hypothetical protein